MDRRTHGDPLDQIAAFAKATEGYAESLEDPDLANLYWGKSLGLWQALVILSAEDRGAPPSTRPAAVLVHARRHIGMVTHGS